MVIFLVPLFHILSCRFLHFTAAKVELPKDQYVDILVSAVNSLTRISANLLGHDFKVQHTVLSRFVHVLRVFFFIVVFYFVLSYFYGNFGYIDL